MAAGMVAMLLPAARFIPTLAWEFIFGFAVAYCLRAVVVEWRRRDWTSALWHGELMVADVAMMYMFGPTAWAPLTVLFTAYAIPFVGLVVCRGVAIELPGMADTRSSAVARPLGRMATLSRPLSTASAVAHLSMAAAMLYMLVSSA